MAKLNFNQNAITNNEQDENLFDDFQESGVNYSKVDPDLEPNQDGFSEEELHDPNAIHVTLADKETPIIVLFGPPSCGKTMTLVRLTRYLRKQGYTISPVRNFRPSHDTHYKDLCDKFDELINSNNAADSTSGINFMLVDVIRSSRRICQILEAPGEYYFNPKAPNEPFPPYVNSIINSNNRKIWTIMVEPDWQDDSDRRNYVLRIHSLKTKLRAKDRVLFMFNKIDKTNFLYGPGRVNLGEARKEVKNLYTNIFEGFKNENPISRLWRTYSCEFVPFQTGNYTKTAKQDHTFQEGPDEYPEKLWRIYQKLIKGGYGI